MRTYFVRRKNAPFLFTNTLIFFALTVVLTRIILSITGYIQISNEVLHIAHLNWGGLLLLIAVIILSLFRGRLVLVIGSIIGGIGWGLFIDEVGKFITVENDYFFRPAAALIYIIFLLFFLVLLYFRKDDESTVKTRLYYAIDYLEEVVEDDFDLDERRIIEEDLESVLEESDDENIKNLSKSLLTFIRSKELPIKNDDIFSRFYNIQKGVNHKLKSIPNRYLLWFFNFLLIVRIGTSLFWFVALTVDYLGIEIIYFDQYFTNIQIEHGINIYLFLVMNSLRFIISIVLIYGLSVLNNVKNTEKTKILKILTITLWISILFIDVFDFYFNQFAAVFGTLVDISLLAFIRDYSENLVEKK